MTNEEFQESYRINHIYKTEGFQGVIKYAKDKLQQYGVVKEVEKGLWVMITGGWSVHDNHVKQVNKKYNESKKERWKHG